MAKAKAQNYAKPSAKATASKSADYLNPSQYFNNFGSLPKFKAANYQQFMEQWIQTSQKNIEAMTACTQMAVEHTKESMESSAAFANKLLQEATSTLQEAFTNSGDPKEKFEEIADCAKYCMEKTATYARKAAEENIQAAQKIGTTLSKRITDAAEEIKSSAA